jgi:hypothetical protein
LQRFVAIKEEILQFLQTDQRKFPQLDDEDWNNDLYFLTDITSHLNELNLQLQGKSQLIFQFIAAVKAFKIKLRLFKTQLSKGDMCHFPTCKKQIPEQTCSTRKEILTRR